MSWWRRSSNWWCCSASVRNCGSLVSRKFFTSWASAALIRRPPCLERPVNSVAMRTLPYVHNKEMKISPLPQKKSAWLIIAPQDQRVFNGIRVVVAARSCNVEAKAFVQTPRARVARAHFERRALRAKPLRFREHVMHQRGAVSASAILRPQRDVVDVNLVEHEPERAEAGDGAFRRAHDVDM